MKIEIVQIKDAASNKYFGFIKQFPSICSQGDTKEQSTENIKEYFKKIISNVTFQETETFIYGN